MEQPIQGDLFEQDDKQEVKKEAAKETTDPRIINSDSILAKLSPEEIEELLKREPGDHVRGQWD